MNCAECEDGYVQRGMLCPYHSAFEDGRAEERAAAERATVVIEISDYTASLEAQLKDSEERETRLREALIDFGRHEDSCASLKARHARGPCDCGLDEALGEDA